MGCTQRSSRGGARFVLGALVSVLGVCHAQAEFSEPTLVSDGMGRATEVSLSLDTAGNAYVASVVDGVLRVDLIGPNRRSTYEIPATAPGQGEPVIAVNTLGVAYLCFSETDPDPSDIGREVYLVTNNGGQFNTPVNISEGRVDDSAPQMAIDGIGFPRVVWSRTVGESSQVVHDKKLELCHLLFVGGIGGLCQEVADIAAHEGGPRCRIASSHKLREHGTQVAQGQQMLLIELHRSVLA